MYTLDFIRHNWILIDSKYFENILVVSEHSGYDILSIIANIKILYMHIKQIIIMKLLMKENLSN